MSRRGLIPVAIAIGFGVLNGTSQNRESNEYGHSHDLVGYVTFKPAYEDLEIQKQKEKQYVD